MITLHGPCEGTLEAKGSRFLASVVPIAQFEETLTALREAHSKANHHVIAWRCLNDADQVQEQAKDDGEPSGTAGRPVLQVLRGQQLVEVGAVVVRYFGGIKLGTGGLARAYAGAVSDALASASPIPWVRETQGWLSASFDDCAILERDVAGDASITVLDRRFDNRGVRLHIAGPAPAVDALYQRHGDDR